MAENDLLSILEANYGRVKIKGDGAWITSPFNPHDKNPSCVVMLRDTDKFTEGFFKDFSTNRSGNIYALLNIPHDFGAKRERIRLPTLGSPSLPRIHISTLDYSPSPYLLKRGIPYEIQQEFKVFELDGNVSMPVFDRDGYFVYNVSRAVEGKGYINSDSSSVPAFLHTLNHSDTVFLCESMIDAYTLFTIGLKAVSLNGAGNHADIANVFKHHFGKIVLALDPDEVGQTNAHLIRNALLGKDTQNLILPYDINECFTQMLSAMDFETAKTKFHSYISRLLTSEQV